MKIMYERNATEEMIFSKAKFQADEKNYEQVIRPKLKKEVAYLDQDYMQYLFDNTKQTFENDGIFDSKDQIKIKRASFEMIVEELEAFNLSDTSDDVKGIAFEQFLGKTFRGELGQFFTPRTIVDYMVDILDPQEGETICDPCCGSGGFLITAFDYVRNKIDADIKSQIDNLRSKYFESDYEKFENYQKLLNAEFDLKNKKGRYYHLSHNCIFGTDANPRMARTAKMNMIMHGDGHGGVHHHDGLIDVNGVYEGRFDIILTNPPFGARVEKTLRISHSDIPGEDRIKVGIEKYGDVYLEKVINPIKEWAEYDNGKNLPKGKSVLSLFETGEMSSLTEVLFIERSIKLLKPGGRMGIVLPEGVLNNIKLQKVRDYVEGKAKIINITSIPQDVFIASGATVKPSLLFFKKFTQEEENKYNNIKDESIKSVNEKYKNDLNELLNQSQLRGLDKIAKKEIKDKLNITLQQIDDEIKLEIKTKFDYDIPIVQVEKAGISTTGTPIENELIPVAEEFKKYRIKTKLWNDNSVSVKYDEYNNKFQRLIQTYEPEIFYE
jgi:type I restriction enzyme M protein